MRVTWDLSLRAEALVVLYKPKQSPYWHYDFQLDGQRYHKSTHTKDKRLAREIETTCETRLLRAIQGGRSG